MSNQEAIERLKAISGIFEVENREAISSAISALTQQLNNGWISITNDDDHYPDAFKNVLFTDGYEIYCGYCDSNYEWTATDGDHNCDIDLVVAWQQLPQVYKEEIM